MPVHQQRTPILPGRDEGEDRAAPECQAPTPEADPGATQPDRPDTWESYNTEILTFFFDP
jgi:hypothetical protein